MCTARTAPYIARGTTGTLGDVCINDSGLVCLDFDEYLWLVHGSTIPPGRDTVHGVSKLTPFPWSSPTTSTEPDLT